MEVGSLLIIGVIASLFTKKIKESFGTEGNETKLVLLLAAVLVGVMYYFTFGTPFWEATVQILGYASAVYAFFLKK